MRYVHQRSLVASFASPAAAVHADEAVIGTFLAGNNRVRKAKGGEEGWVERGAI